MSRDIQSLDVRFKEATGSFRAGDALAGVVQLQLSQDIKFKVVRMHIQGLGRVHWDEKKTYTKGTSSKQSHKHADVYLDENLILYRSGNNMLPKGRHEWKFNFRLLPFLPASFDGNHGRVNYWCKVIIERPWKDYEITKNFNVIGQLDLNTDSDAKKPIESYGEVMAGVGCCRSGPIKGTLSLQRRGFVAGQPVPFNIELENGSRKKLISVRVILSQQVIFKADKQVRKSNTLLKGISKGDVNPGESLSWSDQIQSIPPVVPSHLGGGCKFIDVKYLLTLVAAFSGFGKDLEVSVDVIIGTTPLRRSESNMTLNTGQSKAKGEGNRPESIIEIK